MKRVVALLLVCTFCILAFISCGANSLRGKTYEITKVKVTLNKELREMLGDDADEYAESIKNKFEGGTIEFNELFENINWKIDGNTVYHDGIEYRYSFGKLTSQMQGVTLKLSIKEKK